MKDLVSALEADGLAIGKTGMDYKDPDQEDREALLALDILEDRFPLSILGLDLRQKFGEEDIIFPETDFYGLGDDDEIVSEIDESDIIEERVLSE